MTSAPDQRELARVRNPVLVFTAIGWILLLFEPRGTHLLAHCPLIGTGAVSLSASFPMLLAMNSPISLAAGWALMLVAMMLPVLIPPIRHMRQRSFARRRARATTLFLAGYVSIWMSVGGVLMAIELTEKLLAAQSYLPAASVAFMALIWQFSPIKQRCLNRCHAHPEIAAFGAGADLDAIRFGMIHGMWCAGSCWLWMLLPMLLPGGHLVAMASVTVLIFGERLEQPGPPLWRPRGLGKMTRLLVAQSRAHLHAWASGPLLYRRLYLALARARTQV